MLRFAVFASLIFTTLALNYNQFRKPGGFQSWNTNENQWTITVCKNSTLAELFIVQAKTVINELKSNGSFTEALKTRINMVEYILNENNTPLLTTDCVEYFDGLNQARKRDREMMDAQIGYDRIAAERFSQIIRPFIDFNQRSSNDK